MGLKWVWGGIAIGGISEALRNAGLMTRDAFDVTAFWDELVFNYCFFQTY